MYEFDLGLISGRGADGRDLGDGADVYNIGASFTIGNNLISLDYGAGDETDLNRGNVNTGNNDYTSWRVGGQHKFSNRTKVYATFSQQDFEANGTGGFSTKRGEYDIFSLGMRHNF